jgi:hypothetical protein
LTRARTFDKRVRQIASEQKWSKFNGFVVRTLYWEDVSTDRTEYFERDTYIYVLLGRMRAIQSARIK